MKRLVPILALSVLASACVTATKYKEQEALTLQFQQKSSSLSSELDKTRADLDAEKAAHTADLAKLKDAQSRLDSAQSDLAQSKAQEQGLVEAEAKAASLRASKDSEIETLLRKLSGLFQEKKALDKPAAAAPAQTPAAPAKTDVKTP